MTPSWCSIFLCGRHRWWGKTVRVCRFLSAILHAFNCCYHRKCSYNLNQYCRALRPTGQKKETSPYEPPLAFISKLITINSCLWMKLQNEVEKFLNKTGCSARSRKVPPEGQRCPPSMWGTVGHRRRSDSAEENTNPGQYTFNRKWTFWDKTMMVFRRLMT